MSSPKSRRIVVTFTGRSVEIVDALMNEGSWKITDLIRHLCATSRDWKRVSDRLEASAHKDSRSKPTAAKADPYQWYYDECYADFKRKGMMSEEECVKNAIWNVNQMKKRDGYVEPE